jgi:uncharacterized membrane-anchored protein YitT (DUF2179 family)
MSDNNRVAGVVAEMDNDGFGFGLTRRHEGAKEGTAVIAFVFFAASRLRVRLVVFIFCVFAPFAAKVVCGVILELRIEE